MFQFDKFMSKFEQKNLLKMVWNGVYILAVKTDNNSTRGRTDGVTDKASQRLDLGPIKSLSESDSNSKIVANWENESKC